MKKLIFILGVSCLLCSCTNDTDAKRLLEADGLTGVELTGYAFFMCSEDDTFSSGFKAKNKNGRVVEGAVCGGFLKGYTIRYK